MKCNDESVLNTTHDNVFQVVGTEHRLDQFVADWDTILREKDNVLKATDTKISLIESELD